MVWLLNCVYDFQWPIRSCLTIPGEATAPKRQATSYQFQAEHPGQFQARRVGSECDNQANDEAASGPPL
jgi:hypothetical protein